MTQYVKIWDKAHNGFPVNQPLSAFLEDLITEGFVISIITPMYFTNLNNNLGATVCEKAIVICEKEESY